MELRALREVLGGRVRQLHAAWKVHGMELRALREVLGGRVRQLHAALKVHGLELRVLREVLSGRVRQILEAYEIRGRLRLSSAFRNHLIDVGERAPDRYCFVLLA